MKAFTIQAAKDGQTVTTVRIGSLVCVEKANRLLQEEWQVHITDAAGHQYGPDQFDQRLPSETAFLSRRNAAGHPVRHRQRQWLRTRQWCSAVGIKRKSDPERHAAVIAIFCRYQPMVRFDYGAHDGQSHSHSFRLGGEEWFEDLMLFVFGNTRAEIRHG